MMCCFKDTFFTIEIKNHKTKPVKNEGKFIEEKLSIKPAFKLCVVMCANIEMRVCCLIPSAAAATTAALSGNSLTH